jgi:hypothetical protein
VVELAATFVDPLLRNVMRIVGGAKEEIDEERIVGRHRPLIADKRDGAVGDANAK